MPRDGFDLFLFSRKYVLGLGIVSYLYYRISFGYAILF